MRNFRLILLAVLAGGTALSSCASRQNDDGPCPSAGILYDAERLSVGEGAGGAYSAVMSEVGLDCRYHGKRKPLTASLDLTFDVDAAGAGGREVTLPYFVAVMRGDDLILAREEFQLRVKTDAAGRARQKERIGTIRIPLAPGTDGASYEVIAGFRLTPEQVARNRREKSQLPPSNPLAAPRAR